MRAALWASLSLWKLQGREVGRAVRSGEEGIRHDFMADLCLTPHPRGPGVAQPPFWSLRSFTSPSFLLPSPECDVGACEVWLALGEVEEGLS